MKQHRNLECPSKPKKLSRTFEHRREADFKELKDYQHVDGNRKAPHRWKENQTFVTPLNTKGQK